MSLYQRLNNHLFRLVHRKNLIYNTCWEDPALDRLALELAPEDRVLVITSAGCNALDYVLAGAQAVHAVDVNPIQNALLELKQAGLRTLDYESFFALFGQGRSPQAREMYHDTLRGQLSRRSRAYWDRHIRFFLGKGWRSSFYYRGTSGLLAKLALVNVRLRRLRKPVDRLLATSSLDEQRSIYESSIRDRLWSRSLRWFLSRSFTLSLAGVPWPQRAQIIQQYPGGVVQFVRDKVEELVHGVLFSENYFWRVYIEGSYTPECCPEYLKRDNFEKLRSLLPRLTIHTSTVTDFLQQTEPGISRFVLLDHMDWMSYHAPEALSAEWQAILEKARPGARAIFRSAGLDHRFLDPVPVLHRGQRHPLSSLLRYHPDLAERLHPHDRVHTYGSFHIADLPA
jgi:S-adenosylmethionine-diacylglycerol 3-amino-3-carboxypropyl transferase